MDQKKLYRSRTDKMLFGVCGGLGEFFNIDSTLVRLGMAILALMGPGILFYIAAVIIIPQRPE